MVSSIERYLKMKKIKVSQHDVTDCGAACLSSISTFYGLEQPLARIRQYAGTNSKGTNLLGMVEAAEKLGLIAKAVKVPSDHLVNIPLPAIAHLNVQKKWFHFVVIYKIKNGKIQYMDPAHGEMITVDIRTFQNSWTGIVLLLTPGKYFQKGNKTDSLLKRFLDLIKPHKTILLQSLLGAVLFSLLGISVSIYVGKIVDVIIPSGNRNILNIFTVLVFAILLFRMILGYLKSIMVIKTGQKIDAMLVLGYFRHLMKLPLQFFNTMRTGEIIARVNDAVKIRNFINTVSLDLFVNVLIVFITLGVMLSYSWRLSLIVLLSLPVFVIVYSTFNILNKKSIRKTMENSAELESQLVESIKGIEVIRNFGLEKQHLEGIDSRFIRLMRSTLRVSTNAITSSYLTEMTSSLVILLLLWSGTKMVFVQSLTAGELMSIYTLYNYLAAPVKGLISSNQSIQDALIAADRLFQIMDLEQEKVNSHTISNLDFEKVALRFRQVCFKYPAQPFSLTNIDLEIPPGSVVGVVGESGSGKSTLLSLINRKYTAVSGNIFLNHLDITHISRQTLSGTIATVPQSLTVFSGTIIQNIALDDHEPDIARIISIVHYLGMDPFIEKLPDGLYTRISEDGLNISGGEKQKIAIARALYTDPKILLLDEASSSLDSCSEAYIKKLGDDFKKQGKIVIMIAHRLSSIVHADKIYVMEHGVISESGTHKSLLEEKGIYQRLWQYVHGEYVFQ